MSRSKGLESTKLLDLWQAPAGAGAPLAALATSFTFDSTFFETECLARFAGLQGQSGEGAPRAQLAYLIELEERLADLDVTVLIERSSDGEEHPLRIDVLPVGVRGGLLHAKAGLLVWENRLRFFLGSANLTPAGYRRQLEAVTVFDAYEGSEVPRSIFTEALAALREIVDLVPQDGLPDGPRARASRPLERARALLARLTLPESWPGRMQSRVALTRPGRPALDGLSAVWKGGPARNALVVSPFFDHDQGTSPALKELATRLAQRGDRHIQILVPTHDAPNRTVVLAPQTLRSSNPAGVELLLTPLVPPSEDKKELDRRLHAKGILLWSEGWVAALLGSSNFTSAGLGLDPSRGHVELNVALGLPRGDAAGKELFDLFDPWIGAGEIPEEGVDWEPEADDEEVIAVLPWGFLRALLEPGDEPRVHLELDARHLPAVWQIAAADGTPLIGDKSWREAGKPATLAITLPSKGLLFCLLVSWTEGEKVFVKTWPLNVTDRSKLPPREELRDLSVDEILLALASSRPISEALVIELEKRSKTSKLHLLSELDPLKRYSSTGHLFARTRDLSRALAGLKRHLARPAASLDSLRWRLELAPWSPRALARALIEETASSNALQGEAAFRLAELARTLRSIDWSAWTRDLDSAKVEEIVSAVLDELRRAPIPDFEDPRLDAYVREALDRRPA